MVDWLQAPQELKQFSINANWKLKSKYPILAFLNYSQLSWKELLQITQAFAISLVKTLFVVWYIVKTYSKRKDENIWALGKKLQFFD